MVDSFNTEVSGDAQAFEIESLEVFQDWIILEAQALEFANAARAYRRYCRRNPRASLAHGRRTDAGASSSRLGARGHGRSLPRHRRRSAESVRARSAFLARSAFKAARGHAAKARHYRRRYPVASQAAKAANPARKSARAVHSHVSHGGARASSGDDGDGGDGPRVRTPPRPPDLIRGAATR